MIKPPFTVNLTILNLVSEIQTLLGELGTASLVKPSIKLRKESKIRTIRHSLAIEGNSLTEEQITAILENKRVLGRAKDIREVQNALAVYDHISSYDPYKEKDLLRAHGVLMKGLTEVVGKYRLTNVGIIKGKKVGHVAPQAKMLSGLMGDLFSFLKTAKDIPLLIRACIFHYELEFIHPFTDGNGRMGRLWQQLILMKHSPIFEFVSVESLIHENQKQYYAVLEECDKKGDSTRFIEFSLDQILEGLHVLQKEFKPVKPTIQDRIEAFLGSNKNKSFSRKDYLEFHKNISTATASRDLTQAVEQKILVKRGDKATAMYKKA